MARKKGPEQRRHPRIDSRVQVVSGAEPAERLEMESLNMSLEGVYCTTNRYVPVMTRLRVTLQLPPLPGREAATGHPIDAEAVVVRIEPEAGGEKEKFHVALFFSKMESPDRIRLAEFLDFEHKSQPGEGEES